MPTPGRLTYLIADIFTATPFEGSSVAVVDARAQELSKNQMRLIARHLMAPETTFILQPAAAAHCLLRSFRPDGREIIEVGQNSLGACLWFASKGLLEWKTRTLDTGTLQAYQRFSEELLGVFIEKQAEHFSVAIEQMSPQFFEKIEDQERVAFSLGFTSFEAGFTMNGKWATHAQVVSTSPSRYLLIPVASERVLGRISFKETARLTSLTAFVDKLARGLCLFAPATIQFEKLPTFVARSFSLGIAAEDAAAASAAGPLAAYLYYYGIIHVDPGQHRDLLVIQGTHVGRRCLIKVQIRRPEVVGAAEKLRIFVGGDCVETSEGEVMIPDRGTVFYGSSP